MIYIYTSSYTQRLCVIDLHVIFSDPHSFVFITFLFDFVPATYTTDRVRRGLITCFLIFLWILYKHQLPTCRLTINFDFNIDCMSTFLSQFSDFFLPAVVYPQHVCEYSVLFFSIQTVKLTVQLQFCSPSVSQLGYHCGTFTAQTYWKRIQFSPSSSSSADCLHWYSCYGTARAEYLEDNFEPW